jgi:hypothetical protein
MSWCAPRPDAGTFDRLQCVRCGKELPASAVFCRRCGVRVQPFGALPRRGPKIPVTGRALVIAASASQRDAAGARRVLEYRTPRPPERVVAPAKPRGGKWVLILIAVFGFRALMNVHTSTSNTTRTPARTPPSPRYSPPPVYPNYSPPNYAPPAPRASDLNKPRPIPNTPYSIDSRGRIIRTPPDAPTGAARGHTGQRR